MTNTKPKNIVLYGDGLFGQNDPTKNALHSRSSGSLGSPPSSSGPCTSTRTEHSITTTHPSFVTECLRLHMGICRR
jgi:hypothetical protein